MDTAFFSSGDAIADRRAHYAELLDASGDGGAAIELMQQALELTPEWAAGWDLLGRYCEKHGRTGDAIAAWRRVAKLDAEGIFGARLKLAAHGAAAIQAETATAYVETLFDHYAADFDTHLVEALGYSVPEKLGAIVEDVIATAGSVVQLARALDLGCGTGLMGARIRRFVSYLEGIDIAGAMVAQCARKGIYDAASKAELLEFLGSYAQKADLVTAADVFMYCGALDDIFAAVHGSLNPGGLFAFSVEANDGPEDIILRPSLRYAHAPAAVRGSLAAAGFDVVVEQRAAIRRDRGEMIEGYLVVARKPVTGESSAMPADVPQTDLAGVMLPKQ